MATGRNASLRMSVLSSDERESLRSLIPLADEAELKTIQKLLTGTDDVRPLQQWLNHYFPHYFSAAPSRMHEWLESVLETLHIQRGCRQALIAPRGGAKTTWLSKAYPLYCVVHGLEPYILLISDTATQSEKNLAAIKHELESNPRLAADYPHATGSGPVWNEQRIETCNGVCVEALSIGMKIRGRTFGPHRPSLIIVDDLENDVSVEIPSRREKTFHWFNRAVMSVGTQETNLFVLGTALHRDDLLQRLKTVPGWNCRTFASLMAEPDRLDLWDRWRTIYCNVADADRENSARQFYLEHRRQMEQGAVVLWPQRESLYVLMTLRTTIGEAAFQAEKQGSPRSTLTSEWSEEYFGADCWFDDWPDDALCVMALDPSKGQSESSDFSAFVVVALGADGELYIDADIERRNLAEIVETGLALARRFQPRAFGVEINQFQVLLEDEFLRVAQENRLPIPLVPVTNSQNKCVRIRTLSPYICHRQVRFRRNSPGAARLVDQLQEFPYGRHDDGPDALEMAIRLLVMLLSEREQQPSGPQIITA